MSDTTAEQASGDLAQPVANRRARRVLALILVLLVVLLGVSSYLLYRAVRVPELTSTGGAVQDTGGVTWVRSIYGVSNRPEGLFGQTNVAFPSEDGTIWVTDTNHPAGVMKFNPNGRYLGALTSVNASMPISLPSRVAVGPDGRIYIVETALDRIHVLKSDGSDGGTFTVPRPVSVAVNSDRILVGAVSGFAVLDKTGKPIGVIGSRGKGKDQFDYVHGVAFGPDGSIYVADSYNNRLSAYESNGKLRWVIRTGAPANGAQLTNDLLSSKEPSDSVLKGTDALQLPIGVTVDGAGRLVVVDMFDNTISVFNAQTGKFIAKYGDYGADDGQFFYPVSIGYDRARDWFTVADAFNRRVQIVRIPGSASGVGAAAIVNRALAGPWRACALPLILLLIALAVALIGRYVRRRRERAQGGDAEPTDGALDEGLGGSTP
jgi:sugar lactone lactonase YvrE